MFATRLKRMNIKIHGAWREKSVRCDWPLSETPPVQLSFPCLSEDRMGVQGKERKQEGQPLDSGAASCPVIAELSLHRQDRALRDCV